MAVFLMIFPLKWVHMIIILTSNEIQVQKSISEDVIGFLSILDFFEPVTQLSIFLFTFGCLLFLRYPIF